jgi:hypothetical protein
LLVSLSIIKEFFKWQIFRAFAAVGALEGQLAKTKGFFTKLSEQNLVDCNKNEQDGNWGCAGGSMEIAYDFIKNKQNGGINPAFTYKYIGRENIKCSYISSNSYGKVLGFVTLPYLNETTLMQALVEIGPLAVAVDASLDSFFIYKSGVYDDPNCLNEPNHAGNFFLIFKKK